MTSGLLFAACLLVSEPLQEQVDPWEWVGDVQKDVWADLRTRVQGAPTESREIDWSAFIEADDGWGGTAILQLWQPWKGSARARFVTLNGQNLPGALHGLKVATPSLTAAQAAQSLSLESGDVRGCAALDRAAHQLAGIKIKALPQNYLALHAPGFKVTISPAYRDAREYAVDLDENDLARWAADVLKDAQHCRSPLTTR